MKVRLLTINIKTFVTIATTSTDKMNVQEEE